MTSTSDQDQVCAETTDHYDGFCMAVAKWSDGRCWHHSTDPAAVAARQSAKERTAESRREARQRYEERQERVYRPSAERATIATSTYAEVYTLKLVAEACSYLR